MIRDFSVRAKHSNNKARALFIIFMVCSFLTVMLSALIAEYKGVFTLAGAVLLSVALLLYSKYIAPVYFYDVSADSAGVPLLIVRQQVGKRQSTLCRIALSDITKIEREDSKQRREHKTPQDFRKYSYLPSLDPAVSYRITTVNEYERAEILIEISDEMADLLRSYADEANSTAIDEEY